VEVPWATPSRRRPGPAARRAGAEPAGRRPKATSGARHSGGAAPGCPCVAGAGLRRLGPGRTPARVIVMTSRSSVVVRVAATRPCSHRPRPLPVSGTSRGKPRKPLTAALKHRARPPLGRPGAMTVQRRCRGPSQQDAARFSGARCSPLSRAKVSLGNADAAAWWQHRKQRTTHPLRPLNLVAIGRRDAPAPDAPPMEGKVTNGGQRRQRPRCA
jgi:hypothetical protein